MDSSDDWEAKKDAEKRARYAPVLEFLNSLPEKQGWTLLQFNFTVGVRGSISNVDRTEPLSFMSTLKALGITSRVNLEKIRKVVAKRAFEAHDLMLRSYYAVKFSSSSSHASVCALLNNSRVLYFSPFKPLSLSGSAFLTLIFFPAIWLSRMALR
jgi:hypothetical protein